MRVLGLLSLLGAIVLSACATPSAPPPAAVLPETTGLPVGFGATVAQIQAAFGTPHSPAPFRWQNPVTGKMEGEGTQLRLADRGAWLFWSPEGRLRTIRLEAPFAGSVGGVRIGDSRATLVARRGELPPAQPMTGVRDDVRRVLEEQRRTRPRYVIAREYGASYDFGQGDVVRTIFLTPQPAQAPATAAGGAPAAQAAVAAAPAAGAQPPQPLQQQPRRLAGRVTKETLPGDWISDQPLRIGKGTFKGITFFADGAVAYDRLSIDRVRMFPSSFTFTLDGFNMRATITMSAAAGLKEGARLDLSARFDGNGNLVLGHGGQSAVYRINAPAAQAPAPAAAPAIAPAVAGVVTTTSAAAPAAAVTAQARSAQTQRAVHQIEAVGTVAGVAGSLGYAVDLCGETHVELEGDIRAAYRSWQARNRATIDLVEVYLTLLDRLSERDPARKPGETPTGEAVRAMVHGPQPQLRARWLHDRDRFAAFCRRLPGELRSTVHDLDVTHASQVSVMREGMR